MVIRFIFSLILFLNSTILFGVLSETEVASIDKNLIIKIVKVINNSYPNIDVTVIKNIADLKNIYSDLNDIRKNSNVRNIKKFNSLLSYCKKLVDLRKEVQELAESKTKSLSLNFESKSNRELVIKIPNEESKNEIIKKATKFVFDLNEIVNKVTDFNIFLLKDDLNKLKSNVDKIDVDKIIKEIMNLISGWEQIAVQAKEVGMDVNVSDLINSGSDDEIKKIQESIQEAKEESEKKLKAEEEKNKESKQKNVNIVKKNLEWGEKNKKLKKEIEKLKKENKNTKTLISKLKNVKQQNSELLEKNKKQKETITNLNKAQVEKKQKITELEKEKQAKITELVEENQKQIKELEEKNNKKIEELKKEKEELDNKINDLKDKTTNLEIEKDQFEKENKQKIEELENTNERLEEAKTELKKSKEESENKLKELKKENNKIIDLKKVKEELEEKATKLEEAKNKLEEESGLKIKELEKENKKLEEQINTTRNISLKAAEKIEVAEKKTNELRELNKKLIDELKNSRAEKDKLLKNLEQKNKNQRTELGNLNKKIKELEKEKNELEAENKQKIEELEEKTTKLKKAKEESENKVKELKTEKNKIEEANKKQIKALEEKNNKKIEELNNKIMKDELLTKSKEITIDNLNKENEKLKIKNMELLKNDENIGKLKDKIVSLKSELNESGGIIKSLEETTIRSNEQADKAKKSLRELEDKLKKFEKIEIELENTNEKLEEAETKLESANKKINNLKIKQKDFEEENKNITEFEKSKEKFESKLKEGNDKFNALKIKFEEANEKIEKLEKEKEALKTEKISAVSSKKKAELALKNYMSDEDGRIKREINSKTNDLTKRIKEKDEKNKQLTLRLISLEKKEKDCKDSLATKDEEITKISYKLNDCLDLKKMKGVSSKYTGSLSDEPLSDFEDSDSEEGENIFKQTKSVPIIVNKSEKPIKKEVIESYREDKELQTKLEKITKLAKYYRSVILATLKSINVIVFGNSKYELPKNGYVKELGEVIKSLRFRKYAYLRDINNKNLAERIRKMDERRLQLVEEDEFLTLELNVTKEEVQKLKNVLGKITNFGDDDISKACSNIIKIYQNLKFNYNKMVLDSKNSFNILLKGYKIFSNNQINNILSSWPDRFDPKDISVLTNKFTAQKSDGRRLNNLTLAFGTQLKSRIQNYESAFEKIIEKYRKVTDNLSKQLYNCKNKIPKTKGKDKQTTGLPGLKTRR